MKELTRHAAVAKIIRNEMKKHGIAGRVSSRLSAVTVYLENPAPWTVEGVEFFCSRYEYGHFDSMTDCYNYDNADDSIPQVQYIFVTPRYSEELYQRVWSYLRSYLMELKDAPERYQEGRNFRGEMCYGDQLISQALRGKLGKFWEKPHIRVAT